MLSRVEPRGSTNVDDRAYFLTPIPPPDLMTVVLAAPCSTSRTRVTQSTPLHSTTRTPAPGCCGPSPSTRSRDRRPTPSPRTAGFTAAPATHAGDGRGGGGFMYRSAVNAFFANPPRP